MLYPRGADKMKTGGEEAFRKYISAMLDVIVPSDSVCELELFTCETY